MTNSTDFNNKCEKFKVLLNDFNKIHSITNYKNIDIAIKDSIAGLEFLDLNLTHRKIAIDIGSGAGFPAIFLSILTNNLHWHLFEPNLKKSAFLILVKAELDLKNVTIHQERIENSTPIIADIITSRAVAKTEQLLKICKNFYNRHTQILLYKGSKAYEETSKITNFRVHIFKRDDNRNFILLNGE